MSGQIVDVEKTPIIDGGKCHAPIGEVKILPLQQAMQRQASGLVSGPIRVDALRDDIRCAGNRRQLAL